MTIDNKIIVLYLLLDSCCTAVQQSVTGLWPRVSVECHRVVSTLNSYYQGQEADYVEGQYVGAWVREGTLSCIWPVYKWRIHSQTITGVCADGITVITEIVCLPTFVVFIHCLGLKTNINWLGITIEFIIKNMWRRVIHSGHLHNEMPQGEVGLGSVSTFFSTCNCLIE